MRVKLFSSGSSWGKPEKQFAALESSINEWLEGHPDIDVAHSHRLSQPTFGWGQLAVAIWYSEAEVQRPIAE